MTIGVELVEYLIKNGASIESTNGASETPLQTASKSSEDKCVCLFLTRFLSTE